MTAIDVRTLTHRVQVTDGVARLNQNGQSREFAIKELPETFVNWQLDYKKYVYDTIERNEYIAFNQGHLPVVATMGNGGLFPNLANKGVGFTPRDEHLDHYLRLVEDAVDKITALPPHAVNETRALRINTARELYSHPEHVDWRRLGLLEIFEGTTLRNLIESPLASVLWTGNSPVFLSFQVDCVVELITPDHPRYRFSWAMRRLFEYEPFHIVQTMFPYSYTFWVYEWQDKTPRRRYK